MSQKPEQKSDVYVHPLAVIDQGAQIGKGTKVWHFAHVRSTAKIGERCIIGNNVYVDADVIVGNGVKIQNGVSVYHGVTIEDDVFCGPHMTFTNDMYPRAFSDTWEVFKTLIKKGASIGAHAVIVCDTTLGEYCMVGAGSVVTKNVPPYALVVGNPARVIGFVCKCGQPLQQEVSRNKQSVVMKCSKCHTDTTIPLSDYKLKVR